MSLKLNHSRDYHNYLDSAVENELKSNDTTTNESLWVKMADQLEIEKVPKHNISAIIRKDIEEQMWQIHYQDVPREEFSWSPGNYWRFAKKQEWTNPDHARNVNADSQGSQDNSSINTKNDKMLLLCDKIIDVCRTIKEKAKDYDSLENYFGKKEVNEFYKQQNTMIGNCKNVIDNKTKIPQRTELLLLESLATVMGNTNHCGQVFQTLIMINMDLQGKFLTQKQATKFQTGGKQSQLYLLKPTSRDFAIYEGYTGVQCTCGEFRVRPKQDHTSNWECYDCDRIIPKQHIPKCGCCQIPLYEDRIQHIIKTGKCDNCNEKVDLPQVIIDQVNN